MSVVDQETLRGELSQRVPDRHPAGVEALAQNLLADVGAGGQAAVEDVPPDHIGDLVTQRHPLKPERLTAVERASFLGEDHAAPVPASAFPVTCRLPSEAPA